MSSTKLIEIKNLSKRYHSSDNYAVRDVSLSVGAGEVYGFLGPNGAGKSTTIRTLMGFIQPTSGTATIQGMDVVTDSTELKRHVGYLSGDMATYPKMTGAQYLDYMSSLLPPASVAYRQNLCKLLGCSLHKPLGELSRGNKQKIALVQAFMSKPDVLILDEPTSGLDPLMQEVFYRLVDETKQRGACVFMSSHVLSEIQKTCDRVGIIKQGKLIAEKDMADLITQASQTFMIRFASKPPLAKLKAIAGVKMLSHDDSEVNLQLHGSLGPLFALLARCDVTAFDTKELDVEELFMQYYEGGS